MFPPMLATAKMYAGMMNTREDTSRQSTAETHVLVLCLHPHAAANMEAVSRKHGDSLDSHGHQIRLRVAEFP